MVDPILLTFGAIALVIVLLYLLSGLRILKEWERAPVLRLGRYVGLKGPGVIWIIPGIDRIESGLSLFSQARFTPHIIQATF